MTRSPSFRGADVKRAIKSVREAGLEITNVEITKAGSIIIRTDATVKADTESNPWDEVLNETN
jgi:hypothetical protein